MNLRFSALCVGLLLATLVSGEEFLSGKETSDPSSVATTVADSSSVATTVADSSSVATTVADSPSTDASSSAAPSQAPASPTSVDPSATTQTAESSEAPVSTVSPASGATTAEPSGSSPVPVTSGGSTVSAGPTTPAPLPNVTYSLLQFSSPVCVDASCTYTFNAPGNNQVLLATDQSAVATERTQFSGLQGQASAKDANVKKANDDAVQKIKDLQALLDSIQTNLNAIQTNIIVITNQQNDAQTTLTFVEKFIGQVNSAQGNCLYQRCLKPTTPAPPTTSTAPPPTTTPNPCLAFNCTGSGSCQLDTLNRPYCTNCPGDMDGYTQCQQVACSATGTNFVVGTNNTGVWYSPGYNSNNTNSSVVPANSNCIYNLTGYYQVNQPVNLTSGAPVLNLNCLASSNVEFYFLSLDGFKMPLTSGSSARVINNALGKMKTGGQIVITSTKSDASYCVLPLVLQPATTSKPELKESEGAKKSNGFFNWIMGY